MRMLILIAIGTGLIAWFDVSPARCDDTAPPATTLIKGARFTMGTPIKDKGNPQYHDDEAPLEVTVSDFRIGQYPITAEQMCAFLNSPEAREYDRESLYKHKDLGHYAYSTIELTEAGEYVPRPDAAKAPANQVTWKGAVLFCDWLSKEIGEEYRLPTEAEWELAARGPELRPWPWGSEWPSAKMGPRYDSECLYNSKELADRRKAGLPTWDISPVGSHPANATPEGVHDMLAYIIGEWCACKYAPRPTSNEAGTVDMDLGDLVTDRVVRGYYDRNMEGFWYWAFRTHAGRPWTRRPSHPMDAVKSAARYGFRVAQDAAN